MSGPLVSVVMPAFNAEGYIDRAIRSVLIQTYTDFELLVINDGSTDKTKQVIKKFDDRRIVFIDKKDNLGLIKRLNQGFEMSRARYAARMDADDLMMPDRLKKQVGVLDMNKEIGVVGSWAEIIDERGRVVDKWKTESSGEEIFYTLHFRNCLVHSSVMIRKSVLGDNLFRKDAYLVEDYDLWNRLLYKTKFAAIAEFLVQHREHEGAVSAVENKKQKLQAIRIAKHGLLKHIGVDMDMKLTGILAQDSADSMVLGGKSIWFLKSINKKIVNKAKNNPNVQLDLYRLNSEMNYKMKRLRSNVTRKFEKDTFLKYLWMAVSRLV